MSPELEVGDVILSRSIKVEDIKIGDVVTFVGTQGTQYGLLITHKVIEAPYYDESDKGYIKTQGTKFNSPVDAPVPLENIKAVMVKKMSVLGYFFDLLRKPIGFILLIVLPLLLIAIYQLCRVALMSAKKEIQNEQEQKIEEIKIKALQQEMPIDLEVKEKLGENVSNKDKAEK